MFTNNISVLFTILSIFTCFDKHSAVGWVQLFRRWKSKCQRLTQTHPHNWQEHSNPTHTPLPLYENCGRIGFIPGNPYKREYNTMTRARETLTCWNMRPAIAAFRMLNDYDDRMIKDQDVSSFILRMNYETRKHLVKTLFNVAIFQFDGQIVERSSNFNGTVCGKVEKLLENRIEYNKRMNTISKMYVLYDVHFPLYPIVSHFLPFSTAYSHTERWWRLNNVWTRYDDG